MNWFDKFDKALEVLQRKKEEKKKLKSHRERMLRLEDLSAKFHVLDEDVRLAIPNLYALKWLDTWFGGLENIDLNDITKLASVIWILEHQNASDEINQMTHEQIEHAIDRQLSEIPAVLHPKYLMCIDDIFRMIKKNWITKQKSLYQDLLDQINRDFSGDGQSPLLN
jgi:hypothetical protein